MRIPTLLCATAIALLAVTHRVAAQDPTDATLERLAALTGLELRDWRFIREAVDRGGATDLDDAGWETVSPEHRWQGENRDAWYRLRFTIPKTLAGRAIAHSRLTVRIGVDDYGEIWVDGTKRTTFEWDKGEVVLTDDAEPGRTHLIAIRAQNRGGPGRLLHATLHTSALDDLSARAAWFVDALRLGRLIVDTLGGDARRGAEHVAAAARAVDTDALDRGDADAFLASLDSAYDKLRGLKALTADYHVRAVGYSHIDLAWLWRWEESVQVTKETFQAAIDFYDEFPDFRFSQSQSHAYRWIEERYPKLFAAIRREVATGRWEIVGGTNVELDCNLPGAESHIRQLLYGRRWFQKTFGKDVRIGWCPDSFGYNGNLPQILKKAGVDYFVTAKISWNDTNDFPHNCFWWEAPDGSRVLAFLPMGGYTFNMDGEKLLGHIARLEKQCGVKKVMSVYGVGNHGGGPTRAEIQRAKALAEHDFYPKVEFSTALDYFESLDDADRAKLPTWKDELYLEYHRGTYTTHAAVKKANRQGECGLMTAEKLAVFAEQVAPELDRDGEPVPDHYPRRRLGAAWDLLLFNQMHDILPGSSITPVYRDAKKDYDKMFAAIRRTQRNAMHRIADTTKRWGTMLVFNPVSWARSGVVSLPTQLDIGDLWLSDDAGNPCAAQVVGLDGESRLVFVAHDVPAHGHRAYRILQEPPTKVREQGVTATRTRLENEHLAVTLDPKTGCIASLVHKATGRDAIAKGAQANELQFLEDKPKQYDAWNLGFTGKEWRAGDARSIELVEPGPVRAVIRVKYAFLGPTKKRRHPTEDFPSSFFTLDLILETGSPLLKVRMHADWWEDHVCAKVSFPLSVTPKTCVYDAPYCHIDRSTRRETDWEKARYEVSGQYWADMTEGDFGVAILNDSKYGYDALGNRIRLTLLRAPTSPDRTADRGEHETTWAIYPHAGDWRQSLTIRRGYELNHPMIAHRIERRDALRHLSRASASMTRPNRCSFLSVDADNVIVPVVKRHEDSPGVVVRLFEWRGDEKTKATLTFAQPVRSAQRVDLNERKPLGALPVDGRSVTVPIGRYAIETVLVQFAEPPK